MTEGEMFYDAEIAPALLAIAEKCKAHNMSIVAVVEFAQDDRGSTCMLTPKASLEMVMLQHCNKMNSNLDGYVVGLMQWAKDNGVNMGGSIVARRMGWSDK